VDQATAALLGAFIGASAGITSGVALEMYKRWRDRQGTASALAGEIASILYMTEKRGHVALFENALPTLDAGQDVSVPDIAPGREFRDPVADRYLDRLGLLPWNPAGADRPVLYARRRSSSGCPKDGVWRVYG
jgi:hypothetical protein